MVGCPFYPGLLVRMARSCIHAVMLKGAPLLRQRSRLYLLLVYMPGGGITTAMIDVCPLLAMCGWGICALFPRGGKCQYVRKYRLSVTFTAIVRRQ
jgi:hypothetical protein